MITIRPSAITFHLNKFTFCIGRMSPLDHVLVSWASSSSGDGCNTVRSLRESAIIGNIVRVISPHVTMSVSETEDLRNQLSQVLSSLQLERNQS